MLAAPSALLALDFFSHTRQISLALSVTPSAHIHTAIHTTIQRNEHQLENPSRKQLPKVTAFQQKSTTNDISNLN